MTYAEELRRRYPTLDPTVDDLFLLEARQVAELPTRAPPEALAAVLHSDDRLRHHLVARHPPIEQYLASLLETLPAVPADELGVRRQELAWELADWIVYERAPELYDVDADPDAIRAAILELVDIDDRVVVDVGAGTGQVALAVAPDARHVFAVEPVSTLRRHLRAAAARAHVSNLFVLDGFLHAIPLPASFADVLVTRRAIGWHLGDELAEIERVVRPGGTVLHLIGDAAVPGPGEELHEQLTASGHRIITYDDGSGPRRGYLSELPTRPA